MIRDLLHDIRYGLRNLRRSPGFTGLVVLTLAVGIGANGAIFSVLNALMLRPLPVKEPGRLVFLGAGQMSGRSDGGPPVRDGRLTNLSYPSFRQLSAQATGFAGLAAEDSMRTSALVRWGAEGADEETAGQGTPVTANYFDVLGVRAFRGRTFGPEEQSALGANPVLVLSHAYWQRRFGSDPRVVGDRLDVNGRSYTVVGVAAPGFVGTKVGTPTDFWVPLTMHADLVRESSLLDDVDGWWLSIVGRLLPGVSLPAAEATVNLVVDRHLREIADKMPPLVRARIARGELRVRLEPGAAGVSTLRRDFREPLLALMTGVGLLLLIVCLNVSHLLLARGVQRQREMSIRTALGASGGRLVRQTLAESLLVAGAGAAAGLLAMGWMTDGLLALALGAGGQRALAVDIDGRVLGFTAALALFTAALVGLVPAWQATRANLQETLRGTAQSVAGGRRLGSRLLLTSQVAVSLVLLVGAGLLASSLRNLRLVDKGFDEQHLLLVGVDSANVALPDERKAAFEEDLRQRALAVPGVRMASLSNSEILGSGRWSMVISFADSSSAASAILVVVTPSYFDTVGMALARGRAFTAADGPGAPPVAMVNETLARRFELAGTDVIGRRLRLGDPSSNARADITVTGVVRDARIDSLKTPPRPTVYLPPARSPSTRLDSVQVRAAGDPAVLGEQIRRALRAADPRLRVTGVRTMSTQVDASLRQERLLATVSTAFGLSALFLVCVGLYGVVSQWAGHRTREIGVRMALGATSGGVRWLVLRQAFVLVMLGLAVGLPAAVALGGLLRGRLFGVAATDPPTLALAALAMCAVATLASYLPARRASRVDPMMALRAE